VFENHSRYLRTLLCGIFFPDSAATAESELNTLTYYSGFAISPV